MSRLREQSSFVSGHAFRRAVNAGQLLSALAAAVGKRVLLSVISISLMFLTLTGCSGKHKQARVNLPPPPPISQRQAQATPAPPEPGPEKEESAREQQKAKEIETEKEKEALSVPADTRPIFVETGLASWYGAPYHNRRGSNGVVYNMHEVLQTPAPLDTGGRWAVQIGAFDQEDAANTVADRLSHRYHTAKVLCFNSPVGDWWVRVRVQHDDRKRAEEVARDTQTSQGSIFLVRLD